MTSGTFFDSEPTLQFTAMPNLPTLKPSVLHGVQTQTTRKNQMSRAWLLLWMLPLIHFGLGSLLSLNVAMADSIVPTMADKEAHSNVRLIRMVMDADVRESSKKEVAPEQEQWMADTSQSADDYDEVDVAQYLPLLQSPDANDKIMTHEMKRLEAGQKKKNPFALSKAKQKTTPSIWANSSQEAKPTKTPWLNAHNPFALKKPLTRMQMTSGYGMRWGRMHEGIDLAASQGTPIRAAKSGTVVLAEETGNYGLLVKVNHGDGLETQYAHCSKALVEAGQRVEEGETIALVGSTGRSTGPHLHFEVISEGQNQNPEHYL
jgi:murein DD-endopeptidase MepM/ murein hydrolase activator NlpD